MPEPLAAILSCLYKRACLRKASMRRGQDKRWEEPDLDTIWVPEPSNVLCQTHSWTLQLHEPVSSPFYLRRSWAGPSFDQNVTYQPTVTTGEKKQGSSSQMAIDHIVSTTGLHQNHLGAFYKVQVNMSGPGPSRSHERHMWANGKFSQVSWFPHVPLESVATVDQLIGKGGQGSGHFLKILECLNLSSKHSHYFLFNFDFLLLGLKNLCIKSPSIITTRWEYYRVKYFSPACVSWSSWAIF